MIKKIIAVVLSLVITVSVVGYSLVAFANDITWSFDSDSKTLYLSGAGDMDNYIDEYSTPWNKYITSIEKVVIENGITSVGGYAFSGCSSLLEVQIPDSVATIGCNSFSSCGKLNHLTLSNNVVSIGDTSFAYMGTEKKEDFVLNCNAGSYALSVAFSNSIKFNANPFFCGSFNVKILSKGMKAVYPYLAKVDGTFTVYSLGNFDTQGAVYDSDFNRLSYNDDISSSDTNFKITVNLEKGKTYYFTTNMVSTGITGTYSIRFSPDRFTARCPLVAMANPDKTPSNIPLKDVTVNGVNYDDVFNVEIIGNNETFSFTYGNITKQVTISPDTENIVTFVACDLNNDGYVNVKDYYLMRNSNSKYLSLFSEFWNCKVTDIDN